MTKHRYNIEYYNKIERYFYLVNTVLEESPKEALLKYLNDNSFIIKYIKILKNEYNANFRVKFQNGRFNYYYVDFVKGCEYMNNEKMIIVGDKKYVSKRYTYDELKKMFKGKVVVLEDPEYKEMNLISGIPLEVCDISKRDAKRLEYLKQKKNNITVWEFSPTTLLIGYKEVKVK